MNSSRFDSTKEKLTVLLKEKQTYGCLLVNPGRSLAYLDTSNETVAEHLTANGVYAPALKVGDKIYYLSGVCDPEIEEAKVVRVSVAETETEYHEWYVTDKKISFDGKAVNKIVFLNRDKAEEALREFKKENT